MPLKVSSALIHVNVRLRKFGVLEWVTSEVAVISKSSRFPDMNGNHLLRAPECPRRVGGRMAQIILKPRPEKRGNSHAHADITCQHEQSMKMNAVKTDESMGL